MDMGSSFSLEPKDDSDAIAADQLPILLAPAA